MSNTSAIGDWFGFDPVTKQWFRVLVRGGGQGYIKELAIALNPPHGKSWDLETKIFINDINIMVYKPEDRPVLVYKHVLPKEVTMKMIEHLGLSVTNYLVNQDILDSVDFETLFHDNRKFDMVNHGMPLSICSRLPPKRKDKLWYRLRNYPDVFLPHKDI